MKRIACIAGALLLIATPYSGRAAGDGDRSEFNRHWYLQVQAGAAYTLGETSFGDLVSPAAALSAGYRFSPVWGLRFGLSGWQARGAWASPASPYDYNFLQGNVEATLDLANLFGRFNPTRTVNPYLFAGVGLNYAFNNDEAVALNDAGYDWWTTDGKVVLEDPEYCASVSFTVGSWIELLTKYGVYTESEIIARNEIHMEHYCKVIAIEGETLVDMVQHGILNAVSEYTAALSETLIKKRKALPEVPCRVESALIGTLSSLNESLLDKMVSLKSALETAPSVGNAELMKYYHDEVFLKMEDMRTVIDKLETLTATEYWPYPSYYDMLFSV